VVQANGLPAFRDPIVHGVGLEHTDDPKPPWVPPAVLVYEYRDGKCCSSETSSLSPRGISR
jgi:hypothetical protein